MSNELGRLTQGNKFGVKETDTIGFNTKVEVQVNNKVTYVNFVFDYRPLKTELHRIQLVVSDDRLD